ncbi:MAG: DUF4920 domain-containing protein [Bacteroidota bacterium]|nr:DUF4920 domain-containing protein [Bacteroidota bacterium]
MKTISIILIAIALTFNTVDAGAKKEKRKYGKAITLKEKTKISDIIANPEKFNGKRLLVEGPIVDVCKERGCWIKIGGDKEFESLRFKVEDGVIVFPLEIKGKSTVAEGVLSVKTYSKEDLIKSGEEHAKKEGTEFDPSTITEGKTVIQLKGEGALVEIQ